MPGEVERVRALEERRRPRAGAPQRLEARGRSHVVPHVDVDQDPGRAPLAGHAPAEELLLLARPQAGVRPVGHVDPPAGRGQVGRQAAVDPGLALDDPLPPHERVAEDRHVDRPGRPLAVAVAEPVRDPGVARHPPPAQARVRHVVGRVEGQDEHALHEEVQEPEGQQRHADARRPARPPADEEDHDRRQPEPRRRRLDEPRGVAAQSLVPAFSRPLMDRRADSTARAASWISASAPPRNTRP